MLADFPQTIKTKREIKMSIKKILTQSNFKEWLETKSPKTKVGFRGSLSTSPVARFLADKGVDDVTTALQTNTPKWATNFNTKLSERPAKTISAAAALSLLD